MRAWDATGMVWRLFFLAKGLSLRCTHSSFILHNPLANV